MSEADIKQMVDRFLSWKLPANFNPDGGILFDPDGAKKLDPRNLRYEPSGTNLLDAYQAEEMVRHMLGLPPKREPFRQYAYTGPTPETGYVGYVNIQETETGVRFTVRSEGVDAVTASYEVPLAAAASLMADAVMDYGERA